MKPITASWTNPGWIYARYLLGSVCVRVWIIVCSYNLKLSVFTKTQPSKRNWNSTYTCRIQKHPQNTVLIVTLIKQQCIIYALIFLSKKTVMVLLTTTEKIDLFFLDYIVKFCLPEACWSCSNTSWSKRARQFLIHQSLNALAGKSLETTNSLPDAFSIQSGEIVVLQDLFNPARALIFNTNHLPSSVVGRRSKNRND